MLHICSLQNILYNYYFIEVSKQYGKIGKPLKFAQEKWWF